MGEESSGLLMVIPMKENGKIISKMVTVSKYTIMVHNMRDIGRIISKMDKVWRHFKMEANMKVIQRRHETWAW